MMLGGMAAGRPGQVQANPDCPGSRSSGQKPQGRWAVGAGPGGPQGMRPVNMADMLDRLPVISINAT